CVYWLNHHAPDFESKAYDMCSLYLNALRFFEPGRVVMCTDAKTGMQILQRKYSTQPMAPGKQAQCEHEPIRHGVRAVIPSFVVPTGHVVWNVGKTRPSADVATHMVHVVTQLPLCNATTGELIISTRTEALLSAVWSLGSTKCPLWPQTYAEECSGERS